jgi:hypothetical protein
MKIECPCCKKNLSFDNNLTSTNIIIIDIINQNQGINVTKLYNILCDTKIILSYKNVLMNVYKLIKEGYLKNEKIKCNNSMLLFTTKKRYINER